MTASAPSEHKKEISKEERELERLSKLTPEERNKEELDKLIKEEHDKVAKGIEQDKAIRESAAKENAERLRAAIEKPPVAPDFNSPEAVRTREELARKQALPQQHAEIDATQKPGIPTPGAERSSALSSANETTASKLDRIALVLKNIGADSMGQVRGLQAIREILGY